MFPAKSWDAYKADIRAAGEKKLVKTTDTAFLEQLGLIDQQGSLTPIGVSYYSAQFVRHSSEDADELIKSQLLAIKQVQAITQDLFGVATANKDTASAVLHLYDLAEGMNDRTLGSLLTLMASFGIIAYTRGCITVMESPAGSPGDSPDTIFISRTTPYGNEAWLRRALSELDDHIYWLDKNFLPAAFDTLWEAADGHKINRVRVLSVAMASNSGRRARQQYTRLKSELASRGIELEWRFIDSKLIKGTHDRWIIGNSVAWNVPDVNTILSGSNSEIARSTNHVALRAIFDDYWSQAVEVTTSQTRSTSSS